MSETSVADAKNHLPRLIHQAEHGEPVHITRHGKPVAVLIAEREYARLVNGQTPQDDFLGFLRQWRSRMAAEGLEPLSDDEVDALRDRPPWPDFSWDE